MNSLLLQRYDHTVLRKFDIVTCRDTPDSLAFGVVPRGVVMHEQNPPEALARHSFYRLLSTRVTGVSRTELPAFMEEQPR